MTERLTPDLEKTLRRYVLGDVEDELRSELEELLVTSPDAFEALGVVEDELIEEYLDEALTQPDRQAFERQFLTSPRREARLRFARSLRSRAALGKKAPAPRADWRGRWQPAWLGLAAALAISLGGNVWLATQRRPLPNAPGLSAPVAGVETAPSPHLIGAVVSEGEDVRASLQRERDERLRAAAQVQELQEDLRRSRSSIATFALVAGTLRSAGSIQRVAVPPGAVAVRLRLEVSDGYPLYAAVLVDADGEELWSASRLKSDSVGGETTVDVVLPAILLVRGDYQVKLRGGAQGDELEAVATYAFRVGAP